MSDDVEFAGYFSEPDGNEWENIDERNLADAIRQANETEWDRQQTRGALHSLLDVKGSYVALENDKSLRRAVKVKARQFVRNDPRFGALIKDGTLSKSMRVIFRAKKQYEYTFAIGDTEEDIVDGLARVGVRIPEFSWDPALISTVSLSLDHEEKDLYLHEWHTSS